MHDQEPRRQTANGITGRDGHRRSGSGLTEEPREHIADDRGAPGWNATPGSDGLQARFERDALGYRDNRRGPERDRGGFGIEPRTHRDGREPERDRGRLGIEPTPYSTGRGPQRDRGGLGIEPSAYSNDRGPQRDRGGPALEPNSFRSGERPTLHRPDSAGFELGPDAYRDHGQGAAADRHTFQPSRVSVDPGSGRGQRHAYDHPIRPELERPDPKRPVQGDPSPRSSESPAERDDDMDTAPLPVILPGATSLPRPGPVAAPRGPFEPARTSQPSARRVSVTGAVGPPPAALAEPVLPPPPGDRVIPAAAAAKLDQLKELYLTAAAIGEDALDKHFSQVSQRQQELIREFFERSTENDDIPS